MASSARIDELKKKFDENPRRYFAPLANEYRKAGDYDQAIAICREFLPQQPGHMSGHIVYGQALFDAQQFEEARSVFDTALTLDPENLIALRSLGDIARNLGDPATARVWYQRVLDADPRNEEISAALTALAEMPVPPEPFEEPPALATEPPVEAVEPAPAEQAEPSPRDSGLLILGGTPLDFGESAEAVPEEAAPDPGPIDGFMTGPAAAIVAEPVDLPTPAEPEPPPAAAAPPAEELLDIGELTIEPEKPAVPRISTPRATLSSMGVDLDRVDDDTFMPSVEAQSPDREGARDPFATETMADLYLSQGHIEDALRVYRQLLIERGGDEDIEDKIASIEAMTALTPAIPMEAIPEPRAPELEHAMDLEIEIPGPEPEAAPETVAEAAPEPQTVQEAPQEVPDLDTLGFSFESAAPEVARSPEPEPEPEQEPEPEPEREPELDLEVEGAAVFDAAPPAPVEPESAPVAEPEPVPVMEMAPEPPQPEPSPVEAIAAAGPSIREFLSAFATRVPGAQAPPFAEPEAEADSVVTYVETVETVETVERSMVEVVGEPSPEVPPQSTRDSAPSFLSGSAEPAPTEPAVRGGTIDALFGDGRVATPEESAAATLAGAYGVDAPEPETPPITGAPARRATEELSLDNVFRGPQPSAPTPAAGFSFDQFFAGGTPAQGTPVREAPDGSQQPESVDADIEQFNSWLEGLKKR
jgi:tetratricopeptide (TPR) repeat protein